MNHPLVRHCRREAYDVLVDRSTEWGNPWSHQELSRARYKTETREEAIQKHKEWILSRPDLISKAKRELRGKRLGCWCKPKSCHADTLASIANEEEYF